MEQKEMPPVQSEKRWLIPDPDPEHSREISSPLGCSPIIGQVLLNRGIMTSEEALAFQEASPDLLHDPFLMKDMDVAVDRVKKAIDRHEKVLVFGDYDVDGMSGTALLVRELDNLGCSTYYYIPNRLLEGYALNKERVAKAQQEGVTLIICVDNGVSSHEEISFASELGLDVIVCDHHEPEGQLPPALAILNPKRSDSTYPFRDLAGVGVAFKFATALLGRLPRNLDFAALGTIADIVPLVDENRILVKAGLNMINSDCALSSGLAELCKVSGLEGRRINSGNVAFQLAPRLNAGGRLGVGQLGVQLLLTESQALAQRLARKLDEENRNRQDIEEQILEQALAKVEKEFDPQQDYSIMLCDKRWHQGVIGIVASKLVEKYHRPTVLVAMEDTVGKGSARSIQGFHIYEALSKCQHHLVTFGGHKYAAGLTIEHSNVDKCRFAFEQACKEQLAGEDLQPVLRADASIRLSDITKSLIEQIEMLAPYGNANPLPTFTSLGVSVIGPVKIVRGGHLKFAVRQDGKTIPLIGFKMAECHDLAASAPLIDILFNPQFNTYRGSTTIQLSLRDLRSHTG